MSSSEAVAEVLVKSQASLRDDEGVGISTLRRTVREELGRFVSERGAFVWVLLRFREVLDATASPCLRPVFLFALVLFEIVDCTDAFEREERREAIEECDLIEFTEDLERREAIDEALDKLEVLDPRDLRDSNDAFEILDFADTAESPDVYPCEELSRFLRIEERWRNAGRLALASRVEEREDDRLKAARLAPFEFFRRPWRIFSSRRRWYAVGSNLGLAERLR
mmetsp:Transcript_2409/g.3993  ORF Transcript_2409/g.3993 Transcript_2409/m.3993 type:complete len:224 (-) Transcript_2409:1186-1857(-)